MKKLLALIVTAAMAFALIGCGQEDPKELYTNAYAQLEKAETYETETTINVDLDIEAFAQGETFNSEERQIMEAINSADLVMNTVVDVKGKKQELTMDLSFELGFIKPEINLTMLMDLNNNTVYFDLSKLYSEFWFLLVENGMVPSSLDLSVLEDHIVVADMKQLAEQSGEELNLEQSTSINGYKILNDIIAKKKSSDFKVEELTKNDRKKNAENKVTLTLTEQDIKSIIMDVLSSMNTEEGDLAVIEDDIDEMFNEFKISDFKITTLFDEDGMIIEEKHSVTIEHSTEPGSISFEIDNAYKNVNKAVKFKIDPDNDKQVDMMNLFQQFMMSQMGF
jgi:predicted small lipoprotein YifL